VRRRDRLTVHLDAAAARLDKPGDRVQDRRLTAAGRPEQADELARGELELDGTRIDLARVETPVYVLGCERDHIAPWRTAYATTQLVGGERRFVLASSGHIAGMVSPPGGRAWFRTADETPRDPDAWLLASERVGGTWWDDWLAWAGERSAGRVEPPKRPPGEPAPGSYARVRS
jgi:polyhydroxyalkanoate synthase